MCSDVSVGKGNVRPSARQGVYRLWGHDTFADEDYLIAEYATEAEARAVMRQVRAELARTQDEALRDCVWIEPPNKAGK